MSNNFYLTPPRRCFSYGGYFWNGISQLHNRLKNELKGKSVGFVWNNLIKVGKEGRAGTPSSNILNFQHPEWFLVIKEEIKILSPDIVIFFTGPNYDDFIRNCFDNVTFDPIPNIPHRVPRQLAKITADNLPEKTIRTYHPKFLWMNGFDYYLNDIVTAIL